MNRLGRTFRARRLFYIKSVLSLYICQKHRPHNTKNKSYCKLWVEGDNAQMWFINSIKSIMPMWNVRGRKRLFRCVGNTLYSSFLWNSYHPKTENLKSTLKPSMGKMTWPKGKAELSVQAGTLASVRTGQQKFTLVWSWHNPYTQHGCIWEPGSYSMYNTHSSLLYIADLLSKPSSV